jgi:hypothetical protein
LAHFALGIFVAQVAVMLHHLRIGVSQPLPNFALGDAAQEGLAREKVPKRVKPTVLESYITRRRRELPLERFDYVVNEGL